MVDEDADLVTLIITRTRTHAHCRFSLLAATVDPNNTLYLRFHSTRGCTYDDYDSKCQPAVLLFLLPATWRCNRGDGVGLLALESAPRALQIWFAWCCSDTDRILNCTNAMRTEARGGDRRRCPFAHGIDLGAAGVAAAVIQIRAERSEVASVTMTVTAMTISGLWIVPK